MTIEIGVVFAILGTSMLFFITGWIRADIVAVLVLVSVAATGRLPKNSGSMLHLFSVRSYDPRNVRLGFSWPTSRITGHVRRDVLLTNFNKLFTDKVPRCMGHS